MPPFARQGVSMRSFDQQNPDPEAGAVPPDRTSRMEQALEELGAPPELTSRIRAIVGEWESAERAVLNTVVDGIITIDGQGQIESANPAAERIFGYRGDEMIGQNVKMLMPEPTAGEHDEYLRRYLSTGEARIVGRGRGVTGRRKDGSEFPLYLAVSELKHPSGVRFTGILRDVSREKATEEALEAERSFISAVVDTAGALVVVLDPLGRIVRFNRACETTTGYAAEEVLGKPLWDLFLRRKDIPGVKSVFRELKSGDFPNQFQNIWLTRDGEERYITWANTALVEADGTVTHVVGTGVDITEQKHAEEALVSVSEGVRKLVGQELHDALGQQLTGVSLLAKTLEKKLADAESGLTEDARELTLLARGAVTEARRLAQGLYPTELERHGLTASLAELADYINRLGQTECQFTDRSDGKEVDRNAELHLYRIAQEATNNAVKHGEAENIQLELHPVDGGLELVVSDDGRGFDYEQVKEKGLGLAIQKYRARIIGAEFELSSAPGQGTTVRCRPPEKSRPDPARAISN